jgi:hypothetical protein
MLGRGAGFYRALPSPKLKEGTVAVQATPTQVPADYDRYAADDERGYGWVAFAGTLLLMLGTLNFIEGVGVFVKNQFSRWTGVIVLAGNAIVQLMMIPAYPFWSLSIFTLDILAIYGLIAYGKRISSAD